MEGCFGFGLGDGGVHGDVVPLVVVLVEGTDAASLGAVGVHRRRREHLCYKYRGILEDVEVGWKFGLIGEKYEGAIDRRTLKYAECGGVRRQSCGHVSSRFVACICLLAPPQGSDRSQRDRRHW